MAARWEELQQHGDHQPGARSSHCMAYAKGRIYLFGGEVQPRVPVPADMCCYDAAANTWSKLQTVGHCPGPRVAATMAAIGEKVYLFGGRTGIDMGEGATSDMFVFDTMTSTWSALPPSNSTAAAPPARSYHAMTAAAGKVYVFGGCGANGRLNDLWEFDPAASSWQQLPSCDTVGPRGGSVLVAAPDGSKLFLMGGFNGAEMSDCHSYEVATSTWSCPTCCTTTDSSTSAAEHSHHKHSSSLVMPLARSVFGAALHAGCSSSSSNCIHTGHIIAFGGEVAPSDKGHAGAGNFCAATFCLSPPGQSACGAACKEAVPVATGAQGHSAWHILHTQGEGPGPRGWFAAVAVPGGDLIVHGGLGADNTRLGDMYRLCMH